MLRFPPSSPRHTRVLTLLLSAMIGGNALANPDFVTLQSAQVRALAVETTPAVTTEVLSVDGLLGTIELPLAGTHVLSSPYRGRVARVLVDEGDAVKAGQVLAVIESREVADDRARHVELGAQLALARQQAKRDELLAGEGIIARARATSSSQAVRGLDAAYSALQAVLVQVQNNTSGARTSFELRAPAAGILARRHVMTGEQIDALAPAFVLSENTAWRVTVQVPVSFGPRLKSGARLRVGEYEIPVEGHGLSLDSATQTLLVRGRLPVQSIYIPGQQIKASLRLPAGAGALEVPRAALVRAGDVVQVFQARGTDYRALPVTVLSENAEVAVIGSLLTAGDRVVSSGTSALKSLLER